MNDKEIELINESDFGLSNCCGAKMYIPNVCSKCKEGCGELDDSEEELLDEEEPLFENDAVKDLEIEAIKIKNNDEF